MENIEQRQVISSLEKKINELELDGPEPKKRKITAAAKSISMEISDEEDSD